VRLVVVGVAAPTVAAAELAVTVVVVAVAAEAKLAMAARTPPTVASTAAQ
jgi:hypothetical protein